MASTTLSLFLFFSSLTLISISRAQDRFHGLAHEYPKAALSPSAYDFFHPNTQEPNNGRDPCAEPSCSPLHMAAQFEASQAQRSKISTSAHNGRPKLGSGGIAGIVFGFVFAVLLAMGIYYVVSTRRENTSRAKTVQPEV